MVGAEAFIGLTWVVASRVTEQQGSGPRSEVAVLAGGCFWCFEAIFSKLRGVQTVESGYSGGTVPNPTYEEVCSDETGHAEAVRITFDPTVISYRQLLEIFFAFHDPTTPNRQGADVGSQYRSAIFYQGDAQRLTAEAVIRGLVDQKTWDAPVVTEVKPLGAFYRAEDYHQRYFETNPRQGYCMFVIAPKMAKFRKKYSSMLA
jgi:peptide-methionine (S)-S-oxide reductase